MEYFSKLKINKNFRDNLEPHEVFLDRLAQEREKEIPESEGKIEKPISEKKLWSLFIFVLVIFLFLAGVSFWYQIVNGREYFIRANGNQFVVSSIRAERGVIYDMNLNQLVENQTTYRLMLDPSGMPEDGAEQDFLLAKIIDFTGLSSGELTEKIQENKETPFVLCSDLSYDQIIYWETKSEEWPGVYLDRQLIRRYPQEGGLAHVMGYVSRAEKKGASGLEAYYDNELQDKPGIRQIERDAQGRIINEEIVKNPEPGNSLILNLDYELQILMESSLRAKMEEVGSREANAIAIDPRNGAVRAIVSIPSYDNNIFSRSLSVEEIDEMTNNPDFSLFNQAISGIGYPTGSVIKPLIGVAALEENIIDPDKYIFAPAEICIPHIYTGKQQCYKDWQFHGMTDLRRAIAESVNTYFYMIGGGYQDIRGLGPDKIKSWLARFGWDRITGIDLPNEGRGLLPEIDENWRLGNTYHFSIGQGNFSVTPLQVANAYVALANGGTLYRPQLVHQIVRQVDGEMMVIEEKMPQIIDASVASYDNIKVIREGMRQAVTSPQSSTHSLDSLPVSLAVKTGTAQTGRDNVYHNWIALFAPYEEPEIVMVFMICDVDESMIAVRSVAQDVLNLYFSDKNDKFN